LGSGFLTIDILPSLKRGDSFLTERFSCFIPDRTTLRKVSMSNARSTGCHREPRGQNVLRSIVVPVVISTTTLAAPPARAEVKAFTNKPTGTARLAARVKTVNPYERAPVPTALVLKLSNKFTPSSIADASSQRTIADHPTDVEVFDNDHLVFVNESSAQLVKMVPASIGDTNMQAGQLEPCLLSVLRSLLLSSESAGEKLLPPQFPVVMSGVGDGLASRKSCEVFQTNVNANGGVGLGQRADAGVFAEDRDMPSACGIEADRHTAWIGTFGQWPRPANSQWSFHLGQEDLAITEPEGTPSVFRRSTVTAPLEPRVFGAVGEEVGVGLLEMPECLLEGNGRHFVQERQFFCLFPGGQHLALFAVADGLLPLSPGLRTGVKGPVIDQPAASEGAPQHGLLFRGRLEAISEGPDHFLHGKRVFCELQLASSPA